MTLHGVSRGASILWLHCVYTHLRHQHSRGGTRMGTLSCVFHCLGAEMIRLPFTHNLPLWRVWEMGGGCRYSMSVKYLPRCDHDNHDNDADRHLPCHLNHCASLSLMLWLLARLSIMCFVVHLISLWLFSSLKKRKQSLRGVNLFVQDSVQNLTAEPMMVSASQSFWRLSFCGTQIGGTGDNIQNAREESGEGSAASPRHGMINA